MSLNTTIKNYSAADPDYEIFWGSGYEEELTYEGVVLPRPRIVGIEFFHDGAGFDMKTRMLIEALEPRELVDLSDLSGTCIVRRMF